MASPYFPFSLSLFFLCVDKAIPMLIRYANCVTVGLGVDEDWFVATVT
jgi:hypothetical protein